MFADVGEGEGTGLEEEASEHPGIPDRRGKGRHRSQAGAHEAPTVGGAQEREFPLQLGHQLLRQVSGVGLVGPVLFHPVRRVHEGRHHPRDLQPVDQVVEHRLEPCVLDVVPPVVGPPRASLLKTLSSREPSGTEGSGRVHPGTWYP